MRTDPEVVALIKRALLWAGGTLIIAVVVTLLASCPSRSAAGLPVIDIAIEGHTLKAEVASTVEQRTRGLMYRRELASNSGMLFLYPEKARLSFWMKNTFVPLSIAFLADDGRIVHITDMAPQTTTSHASPEAVRYALEVNRGWFKNAGIKVGHRAQFTLPESVQ